MKDLLPLSILLLGTTTCACDLLKSIGKGIQKEIVAVKNPIDQTLTYIGSSQCSSVKKIIGVSYEQIEGEKEPDLNQLALEYRDDEVRQIFNITSASRSIPKRIAPERKVIIFVHGFTDDPTKGSFRNISEALLSKGEYNVLALDGSSLIHWMYLRSTSYVRFMGEKLGEVLAAMVKNGINPKSIHIIGHSLGSHISGFTGKTFKNLTGHKIGRITGLDPAGPCFSHVDPELRLKSSDADFVDVMHTDAGVYGLDESIGHVDFYPNGGSHQPSCVFQTCSHSRAWLYFAESVKRPDTFQAIKCKDWEEFKKGRCQVNDVVQMGYYTKPTARGNYYLQTGEETPYGIKEKGLKYNNNNGYIHTIGEGAKDLATTLG